MNIPKVEDDSLVIDDIEGKIDVAFSPEIDAYRRHSNSDYLLAQLLSWSRYFNQDIKEIRDSIGLREALKYPEKPSVESLVALLYKSIPQGKFQEFRDKAKIIRKKYKLLENWETSIQTAVVANVILVPPDELIWVHFATEDKVKDEKEKEVKTLSTLSSIYEDPVFRNTQEAIRISKYPSIYFTHKVTINELKDWINKNKYIVRMLLEKLPKKTIIKRDKMTIFWGQVVWILKLDHMHSWTKMSKQIERFVENDPSLEAPEPTELEKYYNRFIKSLRGIIP